ncbi:CBS domain-containing protein [Candidatus Woesearchaeota archaeon]|nr:MAG: CBS domain-containing protein [Candidatus Woesearchaeota archaeon]
MVKIREIMCKTVHTLPKTSLVSDAAKIMRENNISSIVVLEQGNAIGIVTERDITQKYVALAMKPSAAIGEIMSSPIYITTPDKDAVGIASVMKQMNIKKIPVMDKGKLIGIVTDTDLIDGFVKALSSLSRDVEKSKINKAQYYQKTQDLLDNINASFKRTRVWHMFCKTCSRKFYLQENDGKMQSDNCPYCGSMDIDYNKG